MFPQEYILNPKIFCISHWFKRFGYVQHSGVYSGVSLFFLSLKLISSYSSIVYFPDMIFKESALRPILSSIRDVSLSIYLYIYIYVPFPCDSPRGAKEVPGEQSRLPLWHLYPENDTFNYWPSEYMIRSRLPPWHQYPENVTLNNWPSNHMIR